MATASSLTLLLRSWMFEVRSCPPRHHHQWWVARRSATWLWGAPSAHEGRKGIRETWIQSDNILFSLMDMMMTWWYIISPCRSCGIWGRSNTTDVETCGTRSHQAATLVSIPYHCWQDRLHASHPQPLLTFSALKLNDMWWCLIHNVYIYIYVNYSIVHR